MGCHICILGNKLVMSRTNIWLATLKKVNLLSDLIDETSMLILFSSF